MWIILTCVVNFIPQTEWYFKKYKVFNYCICNYQIICHLTFTCVRFAIIFEIIQKFQEWHRYQLFDNGDCKRFEKAIY